MNFYLYLCVTLFLAYQGFAGVLVQNRESTLNSTEKPGMPKKEIFFTSTENASVSRLESAEPKCPENMESFEIRENVWKCLCELPFFPLPMNNTCAKPFRQGPCTSGNMVIQPSPIFEELREPKCIPNTCRDDGLVFYNGTCRNITINRLCGHGTPYFNKANSEISCIYSLWMSEITAPRRQCPPNSRMDRNGICRRKL